jgi:hypothetical protein
MVVFISMYLPLSSFIVNERMIESPEGSKLCRGRLVRENVAVAG